MNTHITRSSITATALCSSLGTEISGTVYIRPLIGVHCMYSYPYLSGFLPFTICPKVPSELQRAVATTKSI